MISNETLNYVHPLVDMLRENDRTLDVVPSSPLCAILQAANTGLALRHDDDATFTKEWLLSIQRGTVLGGTGITQMEHREGAPVINVSTFSRTLAQASDVISDTVKASMRFTRNTAKPIIAEIIEQVEEYVRDEERPTEIYSIVPLEATAAWGSNHIINALADGEARPSNVESQYLPRTAPAHLAEHIVTGMAEFDRLFADALHDCGMTIEDVFESVFGNSQYTIPTPTYANTNLILLQFMLVSVLFNKPWEGVGIGSSSYKLLMTDLLLATRNNAAFARRNYENDVKNRRLVYTIDSVASQVIVNGEVYDKFLDAGATPEVLIGMALDKSGDTPLTFDSLLEKKGRLLRVWEGYHANVQQRKNNLRLTCIKDGLHNAIMSVIKNHDEGILNPEDVENILVNRLKARLERVQKGDLDDLGILCGDVACDVLFPHTPTKYILHRVGQIMTEEKVNGKEAAARVQIEYICNWIASALKVVRG